MLRSTWASGEQVEEGAQDQSGVICQKVRNMITAPICGSNTRDEPNRPQDDFPGGQGGGCVIVFHASTSSNPRLQQVVEVRVRVGGQLRPVAVLQNGALFQDQHFVGAVDGAEAVRDDEGGATAQQPVHGALDALFGRRIESRDEASSRMTRPGSRRKTRANASNCASLPKGRVPGFDLSIQAAGQRGVPFAQFQVFDDGVDARIGWSGRRR